MNEQRKAAIEKMLLSLNHMLDELEALRDEGENELKSLPKAWRNSRQGEKLEETLENLEDALGSLDEVITYLEDAIAEDEEE